jgi:hypothetical protein
LKLLQEREKWANEVREQQESEQRRVQAGLRWDTPLWENFHDKVDTILILFGSLFDALCF